MNDRVMRRPEAAGWLGVSPKTLERWAREGIGPKFVRVGHRVVGYRVTDLVAWAEARTHNNRGAELASAQ